MPDVKSTYREVKTDLKKTARGIDGTDLNDRVENAGDEATKGLGNLRDTIASTSSATTYPVSAAFLVLLVAGIAFVLSLGVAAIRSRPRV